MSRHEGVSCDACMKGNFRGRRYKCLICYDYDLCASCYESGATTSRHAADHPMQCILTRVDFDLYYGGEALTAEQPQSFTCPYCGKMGLTEATLQEHVTSEHAEASTEVVCPVCAALPGGDPNHVTDDLAAHLTVEHRTPRDIDDSSGIRHMRRVLHPGRGIGVTRVRRSNMHFTGNSTGGGGLSSSSASQGSYSPSAREAMDPIAVTELLSQLSGVRRVAGGALNPAGSMASQLQQIHMQLQLERQQAQAARHQQQQQQQQQQQGGEARSQARQNNNSAAAHGASLVQQQSGAANSPFLLDRLNEGQLCDVEQQALECERADHSLFTQELLLSSLLRVADVGHDDDKGGVREASTGSRPASEIPALDGLSLADHRAVKEPPPPPL
uniref:E3 ubiquitin-protein ligase KCMF1 n=1 Tax=Petromyzon marinus TaxID=7757 RepID=S4R646_PETMA